MNNSFCAWINDPFSPGGGRCENKCFTYGANNCTSNPTCELSTGWCEPEAFAGGGCFQYDGNKTACQNKTKCSWRDDPYFDNTSQNLPNKGWCNDGFITEQFEGMQGGPPIIISTDNEGCGAGSPDASIEDHVDICGVGIKDMENAFGIGIKVDNLEYSALTLLLGL